MQSILELFKLEVDYSSISFWQKCKIAQESLIQQLNQHWNYLRQKSIIHQFPFSKSARLHRSHLYSNSINTGTIQARSCRVAQESLIQQLNQHWDYLSQKLIIHQLCFSKSARLHRSALIQQLQSLGLFKLEVDCQKSINTGTI